MSEASAFCRRVAVLFMVVCLLGTGCATTQVKLDQPTASLQMQELLIDHVEYDSKGLPRFTSKLRDRPTKAGERFTIVRFLNGRAEISYDIAVVGPESDFTKPFQAIYEWTGRGFQAGAGGTAVTAHIVQGVHGGDRDAAVVALAIVIAPVVIGTAGGFVVGVVDSMRVTVQEILKVVQGNRERALTYTTYGYDTAERLMLTRMYKADGSGEEVIRTEFSYQGESREPFESVVTTYPDGAKQVVRPNF